ncbi:MAG TPA: bifunctional hydroxymethylpyrimidine kinase/phosphomethylpyrimidine kinase, partial [Desulfurivibrionaceae bacterium]|nr:bifunctional hydroxymethylpyrimidine kinase/phosphomethylpyrimidine kinase [Desulfurivibrionaceae bacterium]
MATAESSAPPVRAILSIAGSDPSGGAGLQADLKTFATLGVYGAAAVTCLTVQNTTGVFATHPVAPEIVKDQAAKVLADLEVSHIKLGMLGNSGIVRA